MTQPKENSEFRSVHAANETLKKYISGGKDISIIRSVRGIDRYDVWQCVFEKEPEAYRELQIKELYDTALKWEDASTKLTAMLFITFLTRLVDCSLPLSLEDGVRVVVDGLGEKCIPALKKEANRSYRVRKEIVEPYHKPDHEWVQNAKKVADVLEKWVQNAKKVADVLENYK